MATKREVRQEKFAAKNARRTVEKQRYGKQYKHVREARRGLYPVPGAFGQLVDPQKEGLV